jgi:hypothetical protein
LHPDSVKVPPFACQIAAIVPLLSEPTAADANVVTHRNGKRVHGIATFCVQLFERQSKLVENNLDQPGKPRQTPRQPRARKHAGHHAGRVQERAAVLEVAAKPEHRTEGDSHDLGITNFAAGVFSVLHGLEQIVNETVYCNGTVVHRVLSLRVLCRNKILGEDIVLFKELSTYN